MPLLFQLLLPFVLAVVVAAACGVRWRGVLPSPGLFFGLALLVVLGLHRAVASVVEAVEAFWPHRSAPWVEGQPPAVPGGGVGLGQESSFEGLAVAVVVAIVAYPCLLALRNAMQRERR